MGTKLQEADTMDIASEARLRELVRIARTDGTLAVINRLMAAEAEVERLRGVNADLLAACQAVLFEIEPGSEQDWGPEEITRLGQVLAAAVAKAEGRRV